MKRALGAALTLAASLSLPACPVNSHDGCHRNSECAPGLSCERKSGICIDPTETAGLCDEPGDCGVNETCSEDGQCEIGDCTFWGCVAGYRCAAPDGVWLCVQEEGAGGTGAGGAAGAAGAQGRPSEPSAGRAGEGGSTG